LFSASRQKAGGLWRAKTDAHAEQGGNTATAVAIATSPVTLSLVDQMIAQGRVALLLRPQIAASLSADELARAEEALDNAMAVVPEGSVEMHARCHEAGENAARTERLVPVEGFFLDRFAVTNEQYQRFVDDGGYEQMSLWDEAIWSAVLGFVDRTGQPGPRFWENGSFPAGKDQHPVVGVSWYEASAFSRWAGKRLPTDAEWVKAGVWPVIANGARPVQRRFPWGEAMDNERANLWSSHRFTTVPVHELPGGQSVNGVQQLVGNVWQWTSTPFGIFEPPNRTIETETPLKSIRGGAFDTYFETQAACQFQSGESPLARKHNIGFRCALGFCDVVMAGGQPEVTQDLDPAAIDDVFANQDLDPAAIDNVLAAVERGIEEIY
jgi:iron(II)-dependent oxidoreductase